VAHLVALECILLLNLLLLQHNLQVNFSQFQMIHFPVHQDFPGFGIIHILVVDRPLLLHPVVDSSVGGTISIMTMRKKRMNTMRKTMMSSTMAAG